MIMGIVNYVIIYIIEYILIDVVKYISNGKHTFVTNCNKISFLLSTLYIMLYQITGKLHKW